MTKLQLVANCEDGADNELAYLMEHYHDYDPEEWSAQYDLLIEQQLLEEQIAKLRREATRKRTTLIENN